MSVLIKAVTICHPSRTYIMTNEKLSCPVGEVAISRIEIPKYESARMRMMTRMMNRTIASSILAPMPAKKTPAPDERIAAALLHLKKADPVLYKAALPHAEELSGRYAKKRRYSGTRLFAALAASVAGQQLSVKAADTIWARLEAACGGTVTPEAVRTLTEPAMRAAGLSAAKARTLKELSSAVLSGELDLLALKKLPEDEAVAKLSSIWGIGRWTAEMFLMFALERADVFSPGDLGLRRSMEVLYGLERGVHARELERIALAWAPHRTFASRALWRIRDSS